jgi:hypothetical protein
MPLFVGELSVVRRRGSRRRNYGRHHHRRHHGVRKSYGHRHYFPPAGQSRCGHRLKVRSSFDRRQWGRSNPGFHPKAQSKYDRRLRNIHYWERAGA